VSVGFLVMMHEHLVKTKKNFHSNESLIEVVTKYSHVRMRLTNIHIRLKKKKHKRLATLICLCGDVRKGDILVQRHGML
jgi:hypothetical protein